VRKLLHQPEVKGTGARSAVSASDDIVLRSVDGTEAGNMNSKNRVTPKSAKILGYPDIYSLQVRLRGRELAERQRSSAGFAEPANGVQSPLWIWVFRARISARLYQIRKPLIASYHAGRHFSSSP
jgi:hypothetical protein